MADHGSRITDHESLSLVLDLGTTTLAGRLLAADGTVLAESRIANPQRPLGADILTRLQRVEAGEGVELQRLLVEGIRALVAELLAHAGCKAEQVVAAAAAGNPGICHLLLGLPVNTLLHPPHRSPLTEAVALPLEMLFGDDGHNNFSSFEGKVASTKSLPLQGGGQEGDGLISAGTTHPHPSPPLEGEGTPHSSPFTLFPAVSGFVGGDLVAVLYRGLGTGDWGLENREPGIPRRPESSPQPPAPSPCLVLDLGTNAELALWDGSRWLATSAAAGPAFEAGNITCGMPLAFGAVTDVQVTGDRLQLTVHGGGRPVGLCGSGLLALVAAAREGGLIDATGRIVAPDEVVTNLARYLVADGEGWAICFHRDARMQLLLTQDDIRQLQLAKGAVRAGIEVLLDRAGLTPADVAKVLLTGAFGAALPEAVVKGIALLPAAMLDKLFCVPNGVLDGLASFVNDPCGLERLKTLHATIKPLPLSGTPAFERRFLAALEL